MASPSLLWFIGRKLWYLGKQRGYVTPGDLLADFYGISTIKYLVAVVSLIALIPYCLIQLIGIGKALEASTSGTLSYDFGVIMALVGIAIYTIIGGIRAIVRTDILQAVLSGGIVLIGGGIVLANAGGF